MNKIFLALMAITFALCAAKADTSTSQSTSVSEAGFARIVAQHKLKPINAAVLPFYIAYTATLTRDMPFSYYSTFHMTYTPYLVCQTQCPRLFLPAASVHLVTMSYMDACNSSVIEGRSTYFGAEITSARLMDNTGYRCFPPAVAQTSMSITRGNGLSEFYVGYRVL